MSLQSEYEVWYERIHKANPGFDDASSPWYKLVREHLGSVAGMRILEVACGRGGFTRELTQAGAHVTGCDFSLTALRVARERLNISGPSPTGMVIQGDAQKLPFAGGVFDAVISCETIEHVPDVQMAMMEMHRVTKPGGQLFLTTPNYANMMGLYELYAKVRHKGRKDDQPFDRRQWFAQIRGWIKRAGWKIERTDGTVHQFPIFPGRNPIRWEGLEASRIVRRLLSPLAFTYFVAAKKDGSEAKRAGRF